jgi:hypothetical protein
MCVSNSYLTFSIHREQSLSNLLLASHIHSAPVRVKVRAVPRESPRQARVQSASVRVKRSSVHGLRVFAVAQHCIVLS